MFGSEENNYGMKKCPICGKMFIPAPEHIYKVYINKTEAKKLGLESNGEYTVCTWHCVREHEKRHRGRKTHESQLL